MAPNGNHRGKRMWPSLPVANQIADLANIFFIGSLVVGVVSTVTIVWMTGVKESYWEQDRQASAERIAALTTQGDQLRKGTADANARAAEATQKATEAQLALEKFKAQRLLSPEQQQRVAVAVRLFAGTKFDVALGQGDLDAELLIGPIEAALAGGGWTQLDWQDKTPAPVTYTRPGRPKVGGVSAVGVIAEVHPSKTAELGPAAESLVSALNAEGVAAIAVFNESSSAANPDAIHVLIGHKPQ